MSRNNTSHIEELVVLLDENLRVVGSAPKLASHHMNTPLHLAFSCWLFNENGQTLITKRAFVKKVWPGVWTNSFCGHPFPDESFKEAILRRAEFELGISNVSNLQKILPDFRYVTPPYKGIVENEYCPVYIAFFQGQPIVNPDEVDNYAWISLPDLLREVELDPDKFSYWMKKQLKLLYKDEAFKTIVHFNS